MYEETDQKAEESLIQIQDAALTATRKKYPVALLLCFVLAAIRCCIVTGFLENAVDYRTQIALALIESVLLGVIFGCIMATMCFYLNKNQSTFITGLSVETLETLVENEQRLPVTADHQ
ncbi:hypothetical protein NHE_0085 [Neorickettsia helminthoeca str. Oregon]|uniref:Uncharacterized protein n=1 Tax=Neorickettsia helminthoeca str. Oregon TaxID=1286528 RepID=X5H3D5_9RICK|nr:hypothetical protein [Neorickettsia helminthoeca]AHX11056.1 hypothetical protein NHE_0085 [Neorickettsia helminthoeca str. Oregon]